MPDKLKGGRLERIGQYILMVLSDYKSVAVETVQDMKDKPVKASIYLTGIATIGLFLKTNPDEQSYKIKLKSAANDLLLVSDMVRNPKSDHFVQKLSWAYKDGKLKYQTFGVFSVMWLDSFPSRLNLFEAKCSHLKTPWYQFHQNVVDIGYLGKWRVIDKEMVDYDVKPSEWESEGQVAETT
ncbi:mitochondrial import inner membrane translocase subunit Tim29-like [Liolophura sinensis]|uniref:mitochondrial import inner membrane translocase subunit Tim29-like n=1 Tax=Liolophura sinensis TaxID=3198878 RepID=UPI0031588589